jgi:hypothetical protein
LQAALFNQTEIALILMDSGANIQRNNGQGWFLLQSEGVLPWNEWHTFSNTVYRCVAEVD